MLEGTKALKISLVFTALIGVCVTQAWSKPATKTPVAKVPATKAPATKPPVVKAPVAKATIAKAPDAKTPVKLNIPVTIQLVVELSNKHRAAAGVGALIQDATLDKAALSHSSEMAAREFFDHESPTPERRWPWDRANLLGIDSDAFGENLHLIEGWPPDETAPRVVDAWMRSPHHRENLLSPKFNHVGIGIATVGSQIYVTQLLSHEIYPMDKSVKK